MGAADVGGALSNKPPQHLADRHRRRLLTLLMFHLMRIIPEVQTRNKQVQFPLDERDLDTSNPSEIIKLNHFRIKVYLWGAENVIKGSLGQDRNHFGLVYVTDEQPIAQMLNVVRIHSCVPVQDMLKDATSCSPFGWRTTFYLMFPVFSTHLKTSTITTGGQFQWEDEVSEASADVLCVSGTVQSSLDYFPDKSLLKWVCSINPWAEKNKPGNPCTFIFFTAKHQSVLG